jgi:hypothetical protein
MIAFFSKCLETAVRETRNVTLLEDRNGVPAGTYVFHEYYCDDLRCDCRRVIVVVSRAEDEEMSEPLATISYGWEMPAFYRKWSGEDDPVYHRMLASVTLEPLTQMSVVAEGLRHLFEEVLENDPQFKRRFHRHYLEFRSAVRGPVRRSTGGGLIKRL